MVDGGDGIQPQATTSAPSQQCVVWVPPECAAPTRLLTGLLQRRVSGMIATDAPTVMQQLTEASAVLALIVVEPDRQPHLNALLHAVQTYYPTLTIWQYQPARRGLTRLERQATGTTESTAAPPPVDPIRPSMRPSESSDSNDVASRAGGDNQTTLTGDNDHPCTKQEEKGDDEPNGWRINTTTHAMNSHNGTSEVHPFSRDHRPAEITPEELDMLLGPIADLDEQQEPPRS